MTREEAIEFGNMWLQINEDCKDSSTYEFIQMAIKALEQEPVYYPPCIDCNKKMDEIRNAYDNMITKALEQEPVLDKIRAEITAIAINGQVDEHTMFIRAGGEVKQMALDIIDKYKAESEDNK